jgi:hypothetical protein
MNRWLKYLVSVPVTLALVTSIHAQEVSPSNDSTVAEAAKVYIECASCDYDFETDFGATLDYFKTEITFVNFVRDRAESDVHILITTQYTATAGREFTLTFIGLGSFSGMGDTLKCFSQSADTQDAIRSELVRTLKMGLMRYVARTPLAGDIAINYHKPALSTAQIDKWNYWVFSIDANTNLNGEKSRSWSYYHARLQAQRTTEKNRFTFSVWGNYNESSFDYGETVAKSISRSKGTSVACYIGLDDHWSVGFGTEVWSSSYSNYESVWELYPGIEYNIFPYSQSTTRQLRLEYYTNLRYNDYELETIYDHWTEWDGQQHLGITLELVEPWGSVETYVTGSHNIPDASMNRIWFGGELSLSLVKGLSLTMEGQYSRIHDQINLAKGDVSDEDVLLQRRQLATSYDYYVSIGFRYSFGSIFTNIVNSRFGG